MLKKILSLVALGSLFVSSALADDVLAKVSKGALSDNSQGVKVLSLDEMKEVKGGYLVKFLNNGVDEGYAIALYDKKEEQYIANYIYNTNAPQGLCGIDQETCSNPSANRLVEFLQVTQKSFSMLPVYVVKRQVKVSDLGNPYVVFTYGVGAYDTKTKQIYQFNSSGMLNNNMVIKEMANKYKEQIEYNLGGWYAR